MTNMPYVVGGGGRGGGGTDFAVCGDVSHDSVLSMRLQFIGTYIVPSLRYQSALHDRQIYRAEPASNRPHPPSPAANTKNAYYKNILRRTHTPLHKINIRTYECTLIKVIGHTQIIFFCGSNPPFSTHGGRTLLHNTKNVTKAIYSVQYHGRCIIQYKHSSSINSKKHPSLSIPFPKLRVATYNKRLSLPSYSVGICFRAILVPINYVPPYIVRTYIKQTTQNAI